MKLFSIALSVGLLAGCASVSEVAISEAESLSVSQSKAILSGFVYGPNIAVSSKLPPENILRFVPESVMTPEEWIANPVGQAALVEHPLCANEKLYELPFEESEVYESALEGVRMVKSPIEGISIACGSKTAQFVFVPVDKEERLRTAAALIKLGARPWKYRGPPLIQEQLEPVGAK